MNGVTITFFLLAAAVAVIDWIAVAKRRPPLERLAKPGAMLLLIGAALTIDAASGSVQTWFVLGLALSLAGDVFLMLENEQFIAGLAAFLAAHIAYIAGFSTAGLSIGPLAVGVVAAAGLAGTIGKRIFRAAGATDARLAMPVAAYIAVISGMFATAAGTANAIAVTGALLFFVSDTILGWNRFVTPIERGRLYTMVTYHAAQTMLVLALLTL